MMSRLNKVVDLLTAALYHGIRISPGGDSLCLTVPGGKKIDPLLRREIEENKELLLDYLPGHNEEPASLPDTTPVSPRNPTEALLSALWQRLLGVGNIGVRDNFFRLGGHSLILLRMAGELRKLGFAIPLQELFINQTIEQLSAVILQKESARAAEDGAGPAALRAANRNLVLLNNGSLLHRLFIIPGIGGMSDGLGELADAFGDSMTVYGIQSPGTGEGEKPCRSIRILARKCIKWVREVQPEGPYWLMGYSFGGNVAYEMARQLEEKKLRVGMVAILDTSAGLRGKTLDDSNKVDFVLQLAADYFEDFKIIKPPYPEWALQLNTSLAKLPVDEMVPHLSAVLTRHLPEDEMAIRLVSRLVNLRIANAQMTYSPPGTIEAPLIIFKTRHDGEEGMDDSLGWAPFATTVHSCLLPGNHDMLNNENPSVIAGYLKNVLDFP